MAAFSNNSMAVSTTDCSILFSSAWVLIIVRVAIARVAASSRPGGGPQYLGDSHIFCLTHFSCSGRVIRNRSIRAGRSNGLTRIPPGKRTVKPSSHSNGIIKAPQQL